MPKSETKQTKGAAAQQIVGPTIFRTVMAGKAKLAGENHHDCILVEKNIPIYLGGFPHQSDFGDLPQWAHGTKKPFIVSVLSTAELSSGILGKTPLWQRWSADERERLHHHIAMDDCGYAIPFSAIDHCVTIIKHIIDKEVPADAIYIHCNVGHGRSWMIAMCAMSKLLNYTYLEAERHIKGKRDAVSPNYLQREHVFNYFAALMQNRIDPAKEFTRFKPVMSVTKKLLMLRTSYSEKNPEKLSILDDIEKSVNDLLHAENIDDFITRAIELFRTISSSMGKIRQDHHTLGITGVGYMMPPSILEALLEKIINTKEYRIMQQMQIEHSIKHQLKR
jgi:hypothetical protein